VATTNAGLVDFIRQRAADPAGLEQARALVKQLGDDSFDVREAAHGKLLRLGKTAVPVLKQAARDKDLEIARRAEQCLEQIKQGSNNELLLAAVRLLGMRQPSEAVEALLDFLPGADQEVAVEVRAALAAIAARQETPDPALVQALAGKDPVRREAAAAVLGKDGGAYLSQPGRRIYLPGRKQALKSQQTTGGKQTINIELTEMHYFNRFEDKVFARP
jgi:HEAT repeat protein